MCSRRCRAAGRWVLTIPSESLEDGAHKSRQLTRLHPTGDPCLDGPSALLLSLGRRMSLAVDVPKVDTALLDFARVPSLSPLLNSVDIGSHRRL